MATQQRVTEYNNVELPLMQQLAAMGWETVEGDIDLPSFTGRESFFVAVGDNLSKDRTS